MKGDLVNAKPVVGLFLEALMLVFIFVYSHGDFTQQTEASNAPLKTMVSLHEIVLRSSTSSQALHQLLPQQHHAFTSFPLPATDLVSKALALNGALAVGQSERNVFYVNDAFNAP